MKAYQVRIKLLDFHHDIWREVIIPADINFKLLHNTIQTSMGWYNSHLYEFNLPDEKLRITNDEESFSNFKTARKKYTKISPADNNNKLIYELLKTTIKRPQDLKIENYMEKYKFLNYIYDFGDNWVHRIFLREILTDYQYSYPTIISGIGACPPEDVGGTACYDEFLTAWSDPNHPEHNDTVKWGNTQHYHSFNQKTANNQLKNCFK
ncbi:plasmid pRiA4b ORF-3 family protein [Pectinatus sottacetonis]|uniref:plasmid pRiA4b ORF-3 family protein n=1 Tax=Pectinatus sottacetonis TaxID=1002795 RepID=UPI0018C54E67|nr:plasmid pRiA4b ORF-3 family protein [Pectinatus sottacetonis]